MVRACFFAAFRNGNLSHLIGYVLLDRSLGCMLVPLPTGVLEHVDIFGLSDVI